MIMESMMELAKRFPGSTVSARDGGAVVTRTFPEVAEDVAAIKRCFLAAKVAPGHTVGILSRNCYHWLAWDLAAMEMGIILEAFPEGADETRSDVSLGSDLVGMIEADSPGAATLRLTTRDGARTSVQANPDVLTYVYSSGTTGRPKRLQISRRGTEHLVSRFSSAYGITAEDCHLIFLPFSNYQQRMTAYGCLGAGTSIVITTPSWIFQDLRAFQPTFLISPPAFYDTLHRRVLHCADTPSAVSALRALLGGRIRLMITGMSPIRRATHEALLDCQLPLFEVYGLTEVGMVAWNLPGCARVGTVGVPVDEGSITLGPDSEIIVTSEAPLSDGAESVDPVSRVRGRGRYRMRTGDVGHFEDGFLVLDGRTNNVLATSGGVKFHPEIVEQMFLDGQQIRHCVVTNRNEGSITTAIVSVPELPPHAAETLAVETARRVNLDLPAHMRVLSVIATDVEFSPVNGFLTRNLKPDRNRIASFFGPSRGRVL